VPYQYLECIIGEEQGAIIRVLRLLKLIRLQNRPAIEAKETYCYERRTPHTHLVLKYQLPSIICMYTYVYTYISKISTGRKIRSLLQREDLIYGIVSKETYTSVKRDLH
jgi:hypothetical protein